ncbi:hypothetical protein Zmor_019218 [Zophobas morio]|uniref:Uncharacterized protein n=1 Tax=Zophobas morio TaxID=2755281 RepID=A0AA38M907_9CUCU|nr:hypothetical protein Zmor_019218 [Zophobas morio]
MEKLKKHERSKRNKIIQDGLENTTGNKNCPCTFCQQKIEFKVSSKKQETKKQRQVRVPSSAQHLRPQTAQIENKALIKSRESASGGCAVGWRHRQPYGIQSSHKMSDKPSHQIYIGRHREHGDKKE